MTIEYFALMGGTLDRTDEGTPEQLAAFAKYVDDGLAKLRSSRIYGQIDTPVGHAAVVKAEVLYEDRTPEQVSDEREMSFDAVDAFKYWMLKSAIGDPIKMCEIYGTFSPGYIAEQKAMNERARAHLDAVAESKPVGQMHFTDEDVRRLFDTLHLEPEPAVDVMAETRKMLR